MISDTVVELSRWQFAVTALFHFLFVPLTLGLAALLAAMETLYVFSGQAVYKRASQFWGKIFAVNFILGFAARLIMLFQFGMHASFFSYYAGDAFALPLGVEMLTTFFLGSALLPLYVFGWERLSKNRHLLVVWLMVFAVNVSALAVLFADSWLQNPLGAEFNYLSMRIELLDIGQYLANPIALSKALHAIAACYLTGAATVLAAAAALLLKNPQDDVALVSLKTAAVFGLVANLLVFFGDSTPRQQTPVQILKQAALQGENPAGKLPGVEAHIRNGVKAYALLQELRDEKKDPGLIAEFNGLKADLGYAMLLQRWSKHIVDASDQQIAMAAVYCLPSPVAPLFWIFRFMIACGIGGVSLFLASAVGGFAANGPPPWLLRLCCYFLPFSWLGCLGGWFVAEAGKQPWAIAGLLPTYLSFSSASVMDLCVSLLLYVAVFALILALMLFMLRRIVIEHVSNLSAGAVL